jgi:nucleotidyltransferase/DNA polymerase involved in DNA repair
MSATAVPKTIHLDIDAFYASVEQREDRTVPVLAEAI